jgi:regulator of replication initiation timing
MAVILTTFAEQLPHHVGTLALANLALKIEVERLTARVAELERVARDAVQHAMNGAGG